MGCIPIWFMYSVLIVYQIGLVTGALLACSGISVVIYLHVDDRMGAAADAEAVTLKNLIALATPERARLIL